MKNRTEYINDLLSKDCLFIQGTSKKLLIDKAGNVYSVWTCKKLKQSIHRGYCRVTFYNADKPRQLLVHRAVLSTFTPVMGWGSLDVDHINCVRNDNRLENLRWATRHQNVHHTMSKKRHTHGSKTYNAILNENNVELILKRYFKDKNDLSFIPIMCKKFGVSKSTIRDVIYKRNWKLVYDRVANREKILNGGK